MNSRCDYKPVSPRQRRRAVRRHGLLVILLIFTGLFGGLLAYLKGDPMRETPQIVAASPAASVTAPAPVAVAPEPAAAESFKSKYDFYTELPKRQVGIQ